MKELIYKIVDFFTFGKGLKKTFYGYPVRLPTRYINYFPANYEPDNFKFLLQQCNSGDIVLDIGAHIGLFATIAAKITGATGEVYAFEPAPKTNVLLQQTIAINKLQSIVEIHDEAMGKEEGKTVFYISEGEADNSNSMVAYLQDRELKGIDVTIFTIDGFVRQKGLNRVGFIKIDVEGAEYDTIRGGTNTFRNMRPACILAIHPEPIAAKGDSLETIYDFINGLNYSITYNKKPMTKEKFCANREMIDLHLLPL